MIVDLLELQPDGCGLVIGVGQKYGGKEIGPDHDFRNGMHELDDQLGGAQGQAAQPLSDPVATQRPLWSAWSCRNGGRCRPGAP
ncbi:MAG: hypothetical protein V7637_758 [Mycobacteriales bacterium]